VLHNRVAREPARGIVPLRGVVSHGAGPERLGRGVIREHGSFPPAAVRKPPAVLHHDIHVMQGPWHRRLPRGRLVRFRGPMDLRRLDAVWEGLPLPGTPAF